MQARATDERLWPKALSGSESSTAAAIREVENSIASHPYPLLSERTAGPRRRERPTLALSARPRKPTDTAVNG
jgi:hypothetical protein